MANPASPSDAQTHTAPPRSARHGETVPAFGAGSTRRTETSLIAELTEARTALVQAAARVLSIQEAGLQDWDPWIHGGQITASVRRSLLIGPAGPGRLRARLRAWHDRMGCPREPRPQTREPMAALAADFAAAAPRDVAHPATRSGGRRARPRDGPRGGRALAPRPERAGRDPAGVRRDARSPGPGVARAARGSDPGRHPRPGGHRAVRPGAGHPSHLPGTRRGAGDAPAWPADAAKRSHWESWLSDGRAGHALGTVHVGGLRATDASRDGTR